jgi:hypothetical protein
VSNDPARASGTSWALQGCLFGAVALFVFLLLLMIFLAYRRFRENTAIEEATPAALLHQPTIASIPPHG